MKPKGLGYRIFNCAKGRFIWHAIIKRNQSIGNSLIILLPECDCLDNHFALTYLDQVLTKEKRDNAFILTQRRDIKNRTYHFKSDIEVIYLKKRQIKSLLQYALLYKFDNRLIIASLDIPEGRYGSRLIGKRGMEREEVFAIGVYKLCSSEK